METATAAKYCVKCNKDVTHAQRMKDAKGAYWCVDCGSKDSQSKHSSRLVCADCRTKYSPDHNTVVGGDNLCEACVAARAAKGATQGTTTSSGAGLKVLKLAFGFGTIAIGMTLIVLYFLGIIG